MAFKEERAEDLSAASRTVDRVVEKIKNNIVWMKNNHNTIAMWLQKEGYSIKLQNVWGVEDDEDDDDDDKTFAEVNRNMWRIPVKCYDVTWNEIYQQTEEESEIHINW